MHRRAKRLVAALLAGGVWASAGCLSRPVEHADPRLKTNFKSAVKNNVIDKIDILFDIDNSASMGDKQNYLKIAIPDLVNRFVNPNCVNPTTQVASGPSRNGACSDPAERPEFSPVHDMHLGIISSSLGPRGGGQTCNPTLMAQSPFGNVQAHNDDHAYLLQRSLSYGSGGTSVTEGAVPDTTTQAPFLYWYPTTNTVPAGAGSPIANPAALISDFTDLVGGTGVFGCGIESQLESWYRFLIQPDPYASISVNPSDATHATSWASWSDVDTTILQQRHDFLRPDSLVVIVVLSDENDSEIDVRSLSQLGYNWMDGAFPPPRGTSACLTDPGSASCQSCAQGNNGSTDNNCKKGPYTNPSDWGFDLNLRHVHMKQKYGVEPQFPIERYVGGLTSTRVPDRCGEYGGDGCPQPLAGGYVGTNGCQNPLFAGALPDGTKTDSSSLCHAPPGSRTRDLVFYAHIGGVPNSLLHFDPNNLAKSVLTDADWTKILGKDPLHYDDSGIDPHMIESFTPRSGIPGPGSSNTADPVNGHDWITDTSNGMPGFGTAGARGHILAVDREYACIFPLVDPTGTAMTSRDCTQPENANNCDCPRAAGGLMPGEVPPLCDPTTVTRQVSAKAYPTIRELLLARLLGPQGIVSSLCPIHALDNATHDDPLYGYRPAVAVIVDRLKNELTTQCLPQSLEQDPTTKEVPCLILLQMTRQGVAGTGGNCQNPTCPASAGLRVPDPDVLSQFCRSLEDQYSQQVSGNGGAPPGIPNPANLPVCELQQITDTPEFTMPAGARPAFQAGTCANSSQTQGWCYVTGEAAGKCAQAIVFTNGAIPNGAISSLQCIEQSVSVVGGGGTAGTPVGVNGSSGGGGGGG